MIRSRMRLKVLLVMGAALFCAASCVYIDDNLGKNLIPSNHVYDVQITRLQVNDVRMAYTDSLSAYNSERITIGAIRDELFGLTTRSSAFTLVPVLDTVDVGLDPVVRQFHFTAVRDTTSIPEPSQLRIMQNVNVYPLTAMLDSTYLYISDADRFMSIYDPTTRISKGVPVYSGGDSLAFDFTDDFARKMVSVFQDDPDIQMDLEAYLKKMPGIYLTTDNPAGLGGRINMFGCGIQVTDYYVTGNYAELKINTRYGTDSERKDTSFLFFFGPQEIDEDTEQYAFNISSHEKTRWNVQDGYVAATDKIYVEGGAGLKPVFSALEFKTQMVDTLSKYGLSPEEVIINKASLVIPFEDPADYDNFYLFPTMLSPSCKQSYSTDVVTSDTGEPVRYVTYAGLTDSSLESENQGDINRSLSNYAPDISHHFQAILTVPDDTLRTGKYDIWLLAMHDEVVQVSNDSNNDMSEYYQNLYYAMYYNNLYNGYGYGSYGYGYGGYGSSYYNNYYSLALLSQLASSSSSSSTQTQTLLDKDRFYRAELNGPESANGPYLNVTYSFIARDADL